MADNIKGLIYQGSPPYAGDGIYVAARMNRRGELIVPEFFAQLAVDGRIFQVSNPTRGTAVAMGGTSFSDTAPAFLVDVPSGTTIIPLEVAFSQGGTVAGAVITGLITYDNKLRYSSGGTAQTIRANRTDAPNASNCSAYSGGSAITAAAVGVANTLKARLISPDVSPSVDVAFPGYEQGLFWSVRESPPPVLVGPASLVIYTYAGTTQPSWFYTIRWAEMPTVMVT